MSENNKLKVLGYVRVSSKEQMKGQSPEAQKDYLKYWCQREGWELVGIEERDVGLPAELLKDMGKRKGLQRILDDPPGGYNAIVAWHNDRLSRDLHQLLEIIDILNKKNVKLIFRNLEGIDLTSASGRLFLEIQGAVAEHEKGINSERVKLGKNKAKEKGRIQGRPLRGFIINKDTGRLEVEDEDLINEFRNNLASGMNPRQIGLALEIPQTVAYRLAEFIPKYDKLQLLSIT